MTSLAPAEQSHLSDLLARNTENQLSTEELVVRGVNALAIEIAATQIKPACAG
jgi:hypothetical protein